MTTTDYAVKVNVSSDEIAEIFCKRLDYWIKNDEIYKAIKAAWCDYYKNYFDFSICEYIDSYNLEDLASIVVDNDYINDYTMYESWDDVLNEFNYNDLEFTQEDIENKRIVYKLTGGCVLVSNY